MVVCIEVTRLQVEGLACLHAGYVIVGQQYAILPHPSLVLGTRMMSHKSQAG